MFKCVDDRITPKQEYPIKSPKWPIKSPKWHKNILGDPVITSQPGIYGMAGTSDHPKQEYPTKSPTWPIKSPNPGKLFRSRGNECMNKKSQVANKKSQVATKTFISLLLATDIYHTIAPHFQLLCPLLFFRIFYRYRPAIAMIATTAKMPS